MSSLLFRVSKTSVIFDFAKASRSSIRFSSSKKSDSKPEEPPTTTAIPPKKQPLTKAKEGEKPGSEDSSALQSIQAASKANHKSGSKSSSKSAVPKLDSQKYISFKDLPKPSKEFQDLTTEQFYARLSMTSIPEKLIPKHEDVMAVDEFKYDFNLNPQHRLLSRRIPVKSGGMGRAPYGAIVPNLSILGISIDTDTLTSGMEEHPLRESITGMCSMNPLMKEIKNKSLWELFPENKKYGSSPFGNSTSFTAFKDWEDSKNAKLKVFEEKKKDEEKEFRDFCKNLQESNSFVRKSAKAQKALTTKPVVPEKSAKAVDNPVETSGRRKLDRGLLRQYRKYRREQLIKESIDEKEDE